MRKITTGYRLAIRVDADTLLAVPPMHPHTPREVRVRVFEYVLRRQVGLAALVAETTAHEIDGVAPEMARLAAIMGETPWASRRKAAA